MSERHDPLPAGFVRFTVGRSEIVCAEHVADAMRVIVRTGSLYEFAERHASTRPLAGRGVAYAVPLPGDVERVVVRHNRHGGALASITRDLFRPPTRAPLELRLSERLRAAGVPTPAILGYVVYAALAGFRRVDVMTREVPDSRDLSAFITSVDGNARERAWQATAALVASLSRAGARHHDLNVKNVLLHPSGDALEGMALDVDRVTFAPPGERVLEANLARLARSARKWRAIHGAPVTDAELDEVAVAARGALGPSAWSSARA
jgi:3-deoxy-D-manno-octulosonic acid kinase